MTAILSGAVFAAVLAQVGDGGTWLRGAPMPTPLDHLACASLDGLVHVIGGRSPTLGLTASTHEVYDPASNTWSTAAELPTGRSGIGAAVLSGLPTPRHGLGVVAIGDAIYVLAGGTRPGDSRSSVVEIFRGN